jgi:hypothetical protein
MFKIDEDKIKDWSIERIITVLGDGVLSDGSECSIDFRSYLKTRSASTLERHIDECISNSRLDKSQKGFIFQDIVNELGSRLDYSVDFGLYRGSTNNPGYDGLWKSNDSEIIVEVKSATHYVFDLDKSLGKYKDSLETEGRVSKNASNLIVIYEGDTKTWEQQINGTPYLWSTRIISVKWLLKLVKLRTENTEDENTHKQIREILKPNSYIKVDKLIEILFSTVEDVLEEDSENEDSDQRTVTTNREEINETRKKAISSLEKKLKVKLVQNSRVLHWDETKKIRVAAIVSKRYERGHQPYWYAYHLKYQNYFKDAEKSYLLICCTDKNKAYAVPGDVINSKVEFLNSTPPDITKLNETDKYYWHLVLKEESNNLTLIIPKNNSSINLEEFACNF